MKKTLSVLITLFALSCISFAQVSLDLNSGLNFSKFSSEKNTYSTGVYFGVQPNFHLHKRWVLGLNVNYSNYVLKNLEVFDYKLSSIDIASTIEYRLTKFWSINTGLNFTTRLSDHLKFPQFDVWIKNVPDLSKKFAVSYLIGTRMYFKNLFLNLKYNFALSQIKHFEVTDETGKAIGPRNYLFENFQLGIGYRINLSKM